MYTAGLVCTVPPPELIGVPAPAHSTAMTMGSTQSGWCCRVGNRWTCGAGACTVAVAAAPPTGRAAAPSAATPLSMIALRRGDACFQSLIEPLLVGRPLGTQTREEPDLYSSPW